MKKQPKKAQSKGKKPAVKAKKPAVPKTAKVDKASGKLVVGKATGHIVVKKGATAKAKAEPKLSRAAAAALAPLFNGTPDGNEYTVGGAVFEKVSTAGESAIQFNGAPKNHALLSVPKGATISLSAIKESMAPAKGQMNEVLAMRALHAFLHPLVEMVNEVTMSKAKAEPAEMQVAVSAKPAPVAKAALLKPVAPVFLPDEIFVKASDRIGRALARVEGDYVFGQRGARILVNVLKSKQQGTFFLLKRVESGSTLHGQCKEGTSVNSHWLDRGINPAENIGVGVEDRVLLHAFLASLFQRYIKRANAKKKAAQIAAKKTTKAKVVAKPAATVTPEAVVAKQPKGTNGDEDPMADIPLPEVDLTSVPVGTLEAPATVH